MMRTGQSASFLVTALLLIPPAASSTVRTESQPGTDARASEPDSPPATPEQKDCPSSASTNSGSSYVVDASELRAQYTDLGLKSEEVRSLVLNARTPEDHLRLASYYGLRADSDLAEAQVHQKIALTWSANSVGSSSKFITGTVNHGLAIVRRLRQHAAKMRRLQQQQEELARQAGE